MIDVNKNNIFQELSDGTFDLASRISSFGNDFDGQVILNETTPGYKAILKGYEDNYMVGDDTYKGVPPGKKEEFIKSFTKNHLINPNTGDFSTTQAEKDYMTNEKFEIDGSVYDGIGAYLLEKEGFTNAPKKEVRLRFNPNSEFFNEEDHVKYVNYLAEKVWSRDTSNPILVRKGKPSDFKGEEGGPTSILSQEFIDKYNKPKKGNNSYNGFVAAAGTEQSVGSQYASTLPLAGMDIYVGPDGQEQVFEVPGGNPMTFEQVAGAAQSQSTESGTVPKAKLIKTMQLANGDFVGEYSIPGSTSNVLVSFDNMDPEPFKIVGKAEPSEHLKQFEYYKLQKQQNPPKQNNASGFNKNKPGGTTTSAVQEVPKSDFEVNAYAGSKPPSTNDEIQIGSNSDGTPRMFSFENSLTEDNYDQLRKSGVREVVWRSYSEIGERTPTLSSSSVLTIPYTKKMEGGNDFSPGTPFTMTDILQAISKSK
jgi:hypothetical protein